MAKKLAGQLAFLRFVLDAKNRRQARAVLESADEQQYHVLREIAANALEGVLDTRRVRLLVRENETRLKKLRRGTLTRKSLGRALPLVRRLVRLALRYHDLLR